MPCSYWPDRRLGYPISTHEWLGYETWGPQLSTVTSLARLRHCGLSRLGHCRGADCVWVLAGGPWPVDKSCLDCYTMHHGTSAWPLDERPTEWLATRFSEIHVAAHPRRPIRVRGRQRH